MELPIGLNDGYGNHGINSSEASSHSNINCSNFEAGNSTTNGTCEEPDFAYILPWWRQLIWSVLFIAMATTATCGNLIVIWIVMSHKRMRTVTNYFIVNLSIADTMVSSLNVPFNFVYMLNGNWPFGNIYCKICCYISMVSVCGSVFTLVAISGDRYNAIMRPLKPRMGRPMTILVAVLIWVAALLIAIPQLLYFLTEFIPNQDRIVCYSVWPDGAMNASKIEFGFNLSFMVVTYFLPMSLLTATYTTIGRELWGQQAIGEATEVQKESIKSKRRVVKMMIMVVMIFGICWFPYHVYFIVANAYPDINYSQYIQEIYLGIYWLAMSNSMYNPMIYCFMNNRFRQGFLRVFRFFCVYRSSSDANDSQAGGLNLKDMPTEMRSNFPRSGVAHSRANIMASTNGLNQNGMGTYLSAAGPSSSTGGHRVSNLTVTPLSSQYDLTKRSMLRSNSSLASTNTVTVTTSLGKKNYSRDHRDSYPKTEALMTHRSSYV